MQPYPHHYSVDAAGDATGDVVLSATGLPPIHTAPPAEFDGPGDEWSPETLFVAAAVDCFILTFRGIARASKFAWVSLRCTADGQLDRVDGKTRFTQLALRAHLTVPPGADNEKARRLLEKAEAACLITNSLALTPVLTCEVETQIAQSAAHAETLH